MESIHVIKRTTTMKTQEMPTIEKDKKYDRDAKGSNCNGNPFSSQT